MNHVCASRIYDVGRVDWSLSRHPEPYTAEANWLAISELRESFTEHVGQSRFRLGRVLGEGSMAVVFEAVDLEMQRRVALKISRLGSPAAGPQTACEFKTLGLFQHRSIVRSHALFDDRTHPAFFTMQLIEGVSLDVWLRPRLMLDVRRLRCALLQLADALREVHACSVVHRDLKPTNILVTNQGRLVLIDFGLAADMTARPLSCEPGDIHGTPAYMAPEQAAGQEPSPASDMYALGVILFEALTSNLPFSGNLPNQLWARQREQPARPSTVACGVPADLDVLCGELMARDPRCRPTAEDLGARLNQSQCA